MARIRFGCFVALTLLLTGVGASAASAQAGVLLVQVRSGEATISGADIELRRGDATVTRTVSDRDGRGRLAITAAGTYTVSVSAVGYRTTEVQAQVQPGHIRVVEVNLAVAPYELEEIQVRSARTQIARENVEFNTTVDQQAIAMLPVLPDANQLVALTPGARAGHVWGGANFQANSYLIDGLSANHPGMGGGLIQPSINWIERVEVRGLGAGAEFGGFQGGQVNVVTKRGTNDFRGMLHVSFENDALRSSNLVRTEIGTEVVGRYEVEGEAGGALVRDRLFYYLGGQRIQQDSRVLNHLRTLDGRFSPALEERTEHKLFGKLTWAPRAADQLELSGGYLDTRAENFGTTGYEAPGAGVAYSSPTVFGTLSYRYSLSNWGSLEARVNRFQLDETHQPYGGQDQVGIRLFALTPPYSAYGNSPFFLRSAPSSTSGRLMGTFRIATGALEHSLRVGAEHTRGGFIDQRIRSGGMTWMPVRTASFDPEAPATWRSPAGVLPSQWGGEVDLDADVANTAAFAQAAIALGSRAVLSPGLRWGQWQGWIDPAGGDRFQAVQDQALDPRVGLMVELTRDGSFVAKAHWGRYHQDMIAQMFDRAAGSDVFTNEELWYYRGDPFGDPTTRFTAAERDALAEQGLFTRESVVVLNETGPVLDYNQPYIDQWLVALEKEFGTSVKLEALYVRRANHDMIALVDRNRATNYTRFDRVRVYDAVGNPLPFEGGSVVLSELYIPNYALAERIQFCTEWPDLCSPPGGYTAADIPNLTWNPDYVLTNAPDARREFGQFQLTAKVERPAWGGSFSVVMTRLEGNLDNVSGYADPHEYSAGPYVRVNEGVNAYGTLGNFSEREAKVSVWGSLPLRLRGGMFWTYASGDHYSPQFRVSALGFNRYRINTGALGQRGHTASPGEELHFGMMQSLEGHYVFVGPRGKPQLRRRANLDLRLERVFTLRTVDVGVSLDLFNVLGFDSVTEVNPMVNNGRNYYYWIDEQGGFLTGPRIEPNEYYNAVLDRVSPRVLRLGLRTYF